MSFTIQDHMKNIMINKKSQPKRGSSKQVASKELSTSSRETHIGNRLTASRMAAVKAITRQHHELREATRLTLGKAIKLGERLAKLREDIGHGGWLLFVKKQLPFCDKTAERYLKVYENRAVLAKFDKVSNLNLSSAYGLLITKKAKATSDTQSKGDQAADSEATETSALVTGISRTVCNGLERLSPTQLRDFETAVTEFKDSWLLRNAPGAAQ